MTEAVLSLSDVRFRWPGRDGFALSVRAFSMSAGESMLLLGESGSGKSTLLSLICGTLLPETGAITIAGRDITRLTGGARDRFRAENIGIIFQQFNLLPFGTVADNILLPLHFAPRRRGRVADRAAAVSALCHALGLPPGVAGKKAQSLSVGQQQRVAVARALIGSPPLIVADEPTSALDAGSQGAFLDLMFAQLRESGAALLMVSHDPRIADRFDRVIDIAEIAQIDQAAA